MARRSGGPAMAATPLMGEPLMMNAIAGPEPSAMSTLSDAIACCMRASPANEIDSISSPCLAKNPLRMPMSSGTNENASGTALPTRSFSAAPAGAARTIAPVASASAAPGAPSTGRSSAFMGMTLSPSGQLQLEKALGIAGEDLPPVAVGDVEPSDGVDGRGDRAQRRVGREHHVVRAEELEPAAHRLDAAAEQRGVAIEVVHVVEVRPLERGQHLGIVLVAGATPQHLQAGTDAAIVEGNHSAEVMGDDLELGIAVEQPVEHHPHHRD